MWTHCWLDSSDLCACVSMCVMCAVKLLLCRILKHSVLSTHPNNRCSGPFRSQTQTHGSTFATAEVDTDMFIYAYVYTFTHKHKQRPTHM